MAVLPSGIPQKGIGGVDSYLSPITLLNTDTSYFTIVAAVTASTAQNFYPFHKNGAIYQVTNGKTCKVEAITFMADSSAGQALQLVSSQTTFAFDASSITSGTYQCGATNRYAYYSRGAYLWGTHHVQYDFPSQAFPGFQAGSTTTRYTVQLHCREI